MPRISREPFFSMQKVVFALAIASATALHHLSPVAPRLVHSVGRSSMVVRASAVESIQMPGPVAVATKMMEGLKASVAAIPLPQPIKIAAVAAVAIVLVVTTFLAELRRRADLIGVGDKCMTTGDGDACEIYDESVDETPAWKLRLAIDKLAQTNVLADKLAGAPPPAGFTWGKTV